MLSGSSKNAVGAKPGQHLRLATKLAAALVVGATTALSSCTSFSSGSTYGHTSDAPATARTYAIATLPPDSPIPNAAIFGVLQGRANSDGTACFWLGGNPGPTDLIFWPEGFSAWGDPLVIRDGNGSVKATVGQSVELMGGLFDSPKLMPHTLGCRGILFSGGGLFVQARSRS